MHWHPECQSFLKWFVVIKILIFVVWLFAEEWNPDDRIYPGIICDYWNPHKHLHGFLLLFVEDFWAKTMNSLDGKTLLVHRIHKIQTLKDFNWIRFLSLFVFFLSASGCVVYSWRQFYSWPGILYANKQNWWPEKINHLLRILFYTNKRSSLAPDL